MLRIQVDLAKTASDLFFFENDIFKRVTKEKIQRSSRKNQLPTFQSQSHIATDGQSISKSWCRAPYGAHDQIFITF
jgi:hypothetical protein